ncbi:MAG TPA: hypothetical protein VKN99_14675 [Polyangia bacterium]|nr:hypothetical protein [Polyangia bacterium]
MATASLWIRRWLIWGPWTVMASAFVCACLFLYGVTRRPARALQVSVRRANAAASTISPPAASRPAMVKVAD